MLNASSIYDNVTPIVVTYNEQENIARQLSSLANFKCVIVLDSFSNDDTIHICQQFSNVKVHQRKFDNFCNQWNHALGIDDIGTSWVLALDADYVLSDKMINEMSVKLDAEIKKVDGFDNVINGFSSRFIYCINGNKIKGSIYPPVMILFKKEKAKYQQDGHTQRVEISGRLASLENKMLHDDRKPFKRWLNSQYRYAKEESLKLMVREKSQLTWKDNLRKMGLGPVLVPLLVIMRGALFSGRHGLIYIAQRTIAECLLAINLWQAKKTAVDE